MLDLILRNGRIVDGTGNPWFFGDVGIKGSVIAEVGRSHKKSEQTVDVQGQVVSPGFIDGHCHSDLMICVIVIGEVAVERLPKAPELAPPASGALAAIDASQP